MESENKSDGFRIAVFGEVGVGTTSFMYRYVEGKMLDYWDPGYMPYEGMSRQSLIDDIMCRCHMQDADHVLFPDYEFQNTMSKLVVRDCDGCILAYSSWNKGSFDRLPALIDLVIEYKDHKDLSEVPIIIIETKNEIQAERKVSIEEGRALAARYNIPFFSTSSRTGDGVFETVEEMVRLIRRKKQEGLKHKKIKPVKKAIPDMAIIPALESTLVSDITTQLFNVEKYSDLTIFVGDKPIYVHKAILFSRSPSFMEKVTPTDKIMNLPNLSYTAVLGVLKYLYTGKFTRENIPNDEYKPAIMTLEIYNLLPILQDEKVEIEGFEPKFSNLFNLNFSSDLKITIKESKKKDHEIFCHKMILCARSEYFRVMYQGGFKESDAPEMIIDDCSYEAMLFLIKYYYLDVNEIEDESIVLDVLKIAHRYNEKPVLRIIEIFLAKKLSIDNVCLVLLLCDMFSLNALKRACLEFVSYRFVKVAKTSAFKKLNTELQKQLESEQKKGLWQIPKTDTDLLLKHLKSFTL